MPLSALKRVEATFITAAKKMLNKRGAGESENNREIILPSGVKALDSETPGILAPRSLLYIQQSMYFYIV